MGAFDLPAGMATSVGTLPHVDPSQAAAFVLAHQPGLPAAPSLPNRSHLERRIAQAAWGVDGVRVQADGSLSLDPADIDPEARLADPGLTGPPYAGFQGFLSAVARRSGLAKFQLTGPISLGVALAAAGLDVELAVRLAEAVVGQRARLLLDLVASRAPLVDAVVVVDEPSLAALHEDGFPVPVTRALDMVSATLAVLEPVALTGLRPGWGSDVMLALETGPQLLVAPASERVVVAAASLDRFLERGGWVAWAAVPTEGPVGSSVDRLWRSLSGVWCQLVRAGADPARLRAQALVLPAGGLGRHHVAQAAAALELANDVARRLYDQATGLRLSAGA
ncbi:MAG: hypothetical protein GEV08_23400 [Acidimicrobiia bacterium]|nr:hypothetical protein [Acidimicrobiia bacterium]